MSPKNELLNVAPDVRLPLKLATEKIAWLATTGAGKTHNASVLSEEFVRVGLPWTAIDPTDAWHGIRSSRDGSAPGLPVVIFGGEHGDVPITPDSGRVVADLVANGEQVPWSVVVTSEFESDTDAERFMTDFAARLLHLARKPFHVFIDEADNFCPQQPFPQQRKMLNKMTKLVRMGRKKGLGVSLITQRPASLNKNVLAMCSTLFLMRIGATAPQDMKAVSDYWKYARDANREAADKILGTLQTLKTGETWIYSPQFLEMIERTRFRLRNTFDSSKTPEPGEERIEPRNLAKVDIDALRSHFGEALERVQEEDPAHWKQKLAEAEARIRNLTRDLEDAREKVVPIRRDLPVTAAQLNAIEEVARGVKAEASTVQEMAAALTGHAVDASVEIEALVQSLRDHMAEAASAPAPKAKAMKHGSDPYRSPQPVDAFRRAEARAAAPRRESNGTGHGFGKGAGALLRALAAFHPTRLTRKQLAALSGHSWKGGGFRNYLTEHRSNHLIEEDGNEIGITAAGLRQVGRVERVTSSELLGTWCNSKKIRGRPGQLLTYLHGLYPKFVTREQLAIAHDLESSGGGFRNYLTALRSPGLIEERNRGGELRAHPDLFLGDA